MGRLGLDAVVSRGIYIAEAKEFRKVDVVSTNLFGAPCPVSKCIQVSGLAKEGARVEFRVVAGFWWLRHDGYAYQVDPLAVRPPILMYIDVLLIPTHDI